MSVEDDKLIELVEQRFVGCAPGPCKICGDENYGLSLGGPKVCPLCDTGNFHDTRIAWKRLLGNGSPPVRNERRNKEWNLIEDVEKKLMGSPEPIARLGDAVMVFMPSSAVIEGVITAEKYKPEQSVITPPLYVITSAQKITF